MDTIEATEESIQQLLANDTLNEQNSNSTANVDDLIQVQLRYVWTQRCVALSIQPFH